MRYSFTRVGVAACFAAAACAPDGGVGPIDPRIPQVTDLQRSCPDPREHGCGMERVLGSLEAQFRMGHTGEPGDPGEVCPSVYVTQDFYLDAYEVTVARFRRYAESYAPLGAAELRFAGDEVVPYADIDVSYLAPEPPLSEAEGGTWTDAPGPREDHPVTGVTWLTALAFCYWDGEGRLPTEAEMEYVLRYRSVDALPIDRRYAWGDDAVQTPPESCDRAQVAGCSGEDGAATRSVGSFPAQGRLYDLTGNADEWSSDLFRAYNMGLRCSEWTARTDYLEDPYDVGIAHLDGDSSVVRGGSFESTQYSTWLRRGVPGTERDPTVGFRCARTIPRGQ